MIKLSAVKSVSVSILKPNAQNEKYFKPETGAYFNQLSADIKKRGITVPLIAKKDGTLLAGHNRLKIAKTIGLEEVPVQYVQGELSAQAEAEFIIKDNVLRRHLTPTERRALYNLVCPGFEERVKIKNSKEYGVVAGDVAEKTGLNPKSVGYDIARIRREKEKERIARSAVDIADDKAINNYKKAVAAMLNISILGSKETLDEFARITKEALKNLEGTQEKFSLKKEQAEKPKTRRLK